MAEAKATLTVNVDAYLGGMAAARRAQIRRLVKWERHRRFLRRHGIPVPKFML